MVIAQELVLSRRKGQCDEMWKLTGAAEQYQPCLVTKWGGVDI